MNISPFSSNIINLLSTEAASFSSNRTQDQSSSSFSSFLTDAFDNAAQADTADKVSALELLIGQSDDLSGLMLDAQKAELSLNLALQIRNKVVDAYNEIMRMSV